MGGMTITEFLLARIAEDEAVARAAIGTAAFSKQTGRWIAEDVHNQYGPIPLIFAVADSGKRTQVANFEAAWERDERRAHIARHDPARVLAECTAKRALVGQYASEDLHTAAEAEEKCDDCRVVYILAAVYADHPDYQQEWKL